MERRVDAVIPDRVPLSSVFIPDLQILLSFFFLHLLYLFRCEFLLPTPLAASMPSFHFPLELARHYKQNINHKTQSYQSNGPPAYKLSMFKNELFEVQNPDDGRYHENNNLVEFLQTLHPSIFNGLGSIEPDQH